MRLSHTRVSVTILGSGHMGIRLTKALSLLSIPVTLLPIRVTPEDSISSIRSAIVVDCMDPSHSCHPRYTEIISRITAIRTSLARSSAFERYIYLSSSNLYAPSSDIILEGDPLLDGNSLVNNAYLLHKLDTETMLQAAISYKLIIIRSAALQLPAYRDSDYGFFKDLYWATKSGTTLPEMPGDDTVITYLSIDTAVHILSKLAMLEHTLPPILNLTTSQWTTRAGLKKRERDKAQYLDVGLQGRRIGTRYHLV